jgi:LysM repeat protein
MKKFIVISTVVFIHAAGFLLISACQTNPPSYVNDSTPGGVYNGRNDSARTNSSAAGPAEAEFVPAESVGTTTVATITGGGSADVQPTPPPPPQRRRTTPPPPPPQQSAVRYHIVAKGEVLGTIARRNGVSLAALAKANNIDLKSKRQTTLRPGQKLIIPAKSTPPNPPKKKIGNDGSTAGTGSAIGTGNAAGKTTYVVKKGDYLERIARNHKVSVAAIKAANNITDERRIRVGQRLTIPKGNTTGNTARAGTPPTGTTTAPAPAPAPAESEAAPADNTAPGSATSEIQSILGTPTATPGGAPVPPPAPAESEAAPAESTPAAGSAL